MKHFSLNLETLSPLAIRADHAPGGVENAGNIPGTTLLGSLAALHRLSHPGDAAAFEQLFLSGQIRYPDLYPASFKQDALQGSTTLPIYPLPKTAQSCKRYPGFKPQEDQEKDDDDGHGVRDSLVDMAIFSLAEGAERNGQAVNWEFLLKPLQDRAVCHVFEKPMPMDHFSGYYRRSIINGHMAEAGAETRLQTRTGINRDTGTVQENILYSRRVFQEHARFQGELLVEDDLAPVLEQFIKEIASTGFVRIGTGRSRGMGKVSLALEAIRESEQDRFTSFKQRATAFNTKLREQIQSASDSLKLAPFYFALTLHSPLILRDNLLRYRGVINEKLLQELLNISADSFALICQNADTRQILGWNELWGMPRTKEVAIDTGSVFLFATTIEEEKALEELLKALFELEQAGIGRRKAESFGRICISDQFHQEVELK